MLTCDGCGAAFDVETYVVEIRTKAPEPEPPTRYARQLDMCMYCLVSLVERMTGCLVAWRDARKVWGQKTDRE